MPHDFTAMQCSFIVLTLAKPTFHATHNFTALNLHNCNSNQRNYFEISMQIHVWKTDMWQQALSNTTFTHVLSAVNFSGGFVG